MRRRAGNSPRVIVAPDARGPHFGHGQGSARHSGDTFRLILRRRGSWPGVYCLPPNIPPRPPGSLSVTPLAASLPSNSGSRWAFSLRNWTTFSAVPRSRPTFDVNSSSYLSTVEILRVRTSGRNLPDEDASLGPHGAQRRPGRRVAREGSGAADSRRLVVGTGDGHGAGPSPSLQG